MKLLVLPGALQMLPPHSFFPQCSPEQKAPEPGRLQNTADLPHCVKKNKNEIHGLNYNAY